MLHILWMILKFILIILGILLGLLVLMVLLVLFCPVRYKLSAVKTEGDWKQAECEGVVSWLFHVVSLKAEWRDRQMEMSFHIFGISVSKLLDKCRERLPASKVENEEKTVASDANAIKEEVSEAVCETGNRASDPSADLMKADAADSRQGKQISSQQKQEAAPEESAEKRKFFIIRIYERIRGLFRAVCSKLQNIHRTFQKIKKNVSWWKALIEHPRVIAARNLVWKHAKFLLKHIFPTKIEGQITFSFEDPALTGTALAVLGMTIPFHKNCVQINPRFDGENYLQGNIKARGRIYGFAFVRAAVIIYFDKNIKYVIKRWKTRRA